MKKNDNQAPFYIVELNEFRQIINSNAIFKIWEQQITSKPDNTPFSLARSSLRQTQYTGKYHFLFQANVTEKIVGISDNSLKHFNVPWELTGQENFNGKDYIVFSGWGDPMNGSFSQFEGYNIGV